MLKKLICVILNPEPLTYLELTNRLPEYQLREIDQALTDLVEDNVVGLDHTTYFLRVNNSDRADLYADLKRLHNRLIRQKDALLCAQSLLAHLDEMHRILEDEL